MISLQLGGDGGESGRRRDERTVACEDGTTCERRLAVIQFLLRLMQSTSKPACIKHKHTQTQKVSRYEMLLERGGTRAILEGKHFFFLFRRDADKKKSVKFGGFRVSPISLRPAFVFFLFF